MTVDDVADILYDYLKRHPCPVCTGDLRVEVKCRKRKEIKRHTFRIVCRGCGLMVEGDDYAVRDLPEDTVVIRGIAETLRDRLKTSSVNISDRVAERLRE